MPQNHCEGVGLAMNTDPSYPNWDNEHRLATFLQNSDLEDLCQGSETVFNELLTRYSNDMKERDSKCLIGLVSDKYHSLTALFTDSVT